MFLGIEIGGTKLQLGAGPGDGTILALERAGVDPAAGAEGIRRQIIELVPELLSKAGLAKSDIRAVGVGFGGPVDTDRGIVTRSHQIEGWAGFPLADWSHREFGCPTVVHNDADTAGLAEACFGAGRGCSPIFYITIGSGIGGGLIIDQKIYRGAGAGAAEIGHLHNAVFWLSGPDTRLAAEFLSSTVEEFCSGWGISRRLQKRVEDLLRLTPNQIYEGWQDDQTDARSICAMANGDISRITTEIIGSAARQGNRFARRQLEAVIRCLGIAVASVITLLCPQLLIIGGGVSLLGEDLLFEPLRREVAKFVFPPFANRYGIVRAALGETVVVHGALRLARGAATEASK